MSIYPERNRRTKRFTGYWIAEHHRRKSRHASFEEAEDAEAIMRGRELPKDVPKASSVFTLRDLNDKAGPILWKGTKDQLRSERRWLTCLKILGPDTPVSAIRKPQLESLVNSLSDRGPKTINRYLATVSRALRWAHETDLIAGPPAVPWQREGEGRKVYLPEHLDHAFLEAVEAAGGALARLGIYLLLTTGMRASELLTLSRDDLVNDVIHLQRTKTGRPRSIPCDGRAVEAFLQMAPRTASKARGEGSGGKQQVSYRLLLNACHRASKALGIDPPITPHALRHTVATRLVAKGVNALTVARLLGHSSLATTRGYAHHETSTLRDALAGICRVTALGSVEKRLQIQGRPSRSGKASDYLCVFNALQTPFRLTTSYRLNEPGSSNARHRRTLRQTN